MSTAVAETLMRAIQHAAIYRSRPHCPIAVTEKLMCTTNPIHFIPLRRTLIGRAGHAHIVYVLYLDQSRPPLMSRNQM